MGWRPTMRLADKWLAQISFNANGLQTPNANNPLQPGDYVLTISDVMTGDETKGAGARLDGDYNGSPTGLFQFHFTIPDPKLGVENLVTSTNSQYVQTTSTPAGMGLGREQSVRSVAIDHSGDFVVVWTSYGQDDSNDPNGAGIYFSLYDRNNNLLKTGQVNTYTKGNQDDATVAMDAVGDFVVVWESQGEDPDGSWGIYAQRFDSKGNALGVEFRVNTITTNDQRDPAVACDDLGNFVVVWATQGQSFSYFNDIDGQYFDYNGNPVGNEFMVNSQDLPGTKLPDGTRMSIQAWLCFLGA